MSIEALLQSLELSIECQYQIPAGSLSTLKDIEANGLNWICSIRRKNGKPVEFKYFQGIGHLEKSGVKFPFSPTGRRIISMSDWKALLQTVLTGYVCRHTTMGVQTVKEPIPPAERQEGSLLSFRSKRLVSPTLADVLSCVVSDSYAFQTSFDVWCDEFGYDTDSRKALQVYNDCRDNACKLFTLVSLKEFAELQTAFQNY